MILEQWLTLAACTAFLGLAFLVALRGTKSPMGFSLALLCVDLFAYNILEFLGNLTDGRGWGWLESASAAMAAPLTLHLTLRFLGQAHRRRWLLRGAYLYFGGIALSCLLPYLEPSLSRYPGGERWAQLMLVGILPLFLTVAVLTIRHYRAVRNTEERFRTQLLVSALTLGVGGATTDLASLAGTQEAPHFAAVGMLASAGVLALLALRVSLLEEVRPMILLNALLLGAIGVFGQLIVFRFLGTSSAAFALGSVVITLALLAVLRRWLVIFNAYRTRAEYLSTLGRFSAQMAHDIRNPLAAIMGAAQFLKEERSQGRSLDDHADFLDLILEQSERLKSVVEDYQRLGRAEPVLAPLAPAELLESVVLGARSSFGDGIELTLHLGAGLDPSTEEGAKATVAADRDLLAGALENVLRNAMEAMEGKGKIEVLAEIAPRRGGDALRVEVRDDGPGMNPRVRERVFDEMFTTKKEGTGLGLAFVRRVAEAHGGRVTLESALGKGTTVGIEIPLPAFEEEEAPSPERRAEAGSRAGTGAA